MTDVFCDGGSRGNPGHAAYGFVIYQDGHILKEGKGYIGIATNNVAEYTAIIKALSWLKNSCKGAALRFSLDSQLVVSQLSGIYKVKNSNIRNLVFQIRSLENNFHSVSYHFIPREQNAAADSLVNRALDDHLNH